jgi:hypothetical protein
VGAEIGETSVLGPPGADETDGDPLDSARRDATGYLSHLTHPATRHVLFAVNDRWTAVVNNEREGSDFADSQWWFGRLCGARSCRVVDDEGQVRRVRGYRVRDSFPARIFELAESDGSTVRSVHCTLDGDRWDFGTSGSPLPAESAFAYSARRKRDRFTSENLQTFLCSLGVVPTVHHAFETADRFVLLAERLKDPLWAADVEAESCTPAQARRRRLRLLPARPDMGPAHGIARRKRRVGHDKSRALEPGPRKRGAALPRRRTEAAWTCAV